MAKKKAEKTVSSVLGVPTKNFEGYLKFFNKNNLRELIVKEHGTVISLKKDDGGSVQPVMVSQVMAAPQSAAASAAPTQKPAAAAAAPAADKHEAITSPIIGTFYEAPSPGSPPYVKPGQSINKGDTLCIVEAMKVMNKITAEFSCKIVKCMKANGDGVKAGDSLFLIDKA